MKRIEKLIFALIFGSSFPILCGMIAVILWFYLNHDENVALYFALAGLTAGLLLDGVYLKKLINNAFDLPIGLLVAFYVFYNICIFGFFMGFPVFNLFMGVIAGYYFGKRIIHKNIALTQRAFIVRKVSLFAGIVMLLICISSGLIAILHESTSEELHSMLRLGFEVTRGMLVALILIGGSTLIICQYVLTKVTLMKTMETHNKSFS